MMRRRCYWVAAVILIASMTAACTKAVVIPRADWADYEKRIEGSYRIRLTSREDYLVRRFSTTDSTVVIEEMLPGDERYRTRRTELPIAIPLSEVESIAETRTNWGVLGPVVLIGTAALGYFLYLLITLDGSD